MSELIHITTDGQGSSVVSARELYTFLEVKARFNDWFKRRVIKYGFQAETDYVELDGVILNSEYNPTGGRPETDYALTLDMAKQLSMVENNDKGQQARRYFIDCERKATTPPVPALPSATEQMMLQLMNQQAQLMAGQQAMLEQLRADVETIRQTGHRPTQKSRRLPAAPARPPHLLGPASLRQQIVRKVNEYCTRHGVEHSEAYKYLYRRLSLDFGFNVHTYRLDSERPLDTIERYGKLIQLLSIIDSELAYTEG